VKTTGGIGLIIISD